MLRTTKYVGYRDPQQQDQARNETRQEKNQLRDARMDYYLQHKPKGYHDLPHNDGTDQLKNEEDEGNDHAPHKLWWVLQEA